MNVPEAFFQPVAIIHDRLVGVRFPWAITGSLGMALQGMRLTIHDIDLQTTRLGAHGIEQALAEYVSLPVTYKKSEKIRSHFGAMEIAGFTVEIIGDVEKLQAGGQWTEAPDLPRLIHWVDLSGMRLPVLNLSYEVEAYRQMGRLKKAAAIEKFLESQRS